MSNNEELNEETLNVTEHRPVSAQRSTEEELKYVCEICGKRFRTSQELAGHVRMTGHKVGGGINNKDETQLEVIKPPEVEVIDSAIEFISERLPKVYGIEKYGRIIVEYLKDNPAPIRDANTLHAFIKSIAPRAYDSHISTFVIGPLYAKFPNLAECVDKLLSSTRVQQYQVYPFQTYQYPYTYQPTYYPPYYPQYYPPHQPTYPVRPHRVYKIVVDGQEIETDEAGYMAWQKYLKEREEHEMRKKEHELMMKKLEAEIKKMSEDNENRVPIPIRIGDKEVQIQVPESLAPLYLISIGDSDSVEELKRKLDEEREARHKIELEILRKELEEVRNRPSFIEELRHYHEIAEELGFQKTGRTTADLLNSLFERIDQRAAQIISKIPTTTNEWKPEVKMGVEERNKKAEEILSKLDKAEEILKYEDELIRAAAKVKPKVVE